MRNNPKQRLILYPKKDIQFKVSAMFCKTLKQAEDILWQRQKENLNRAVFYDGKGIATELI